jgi:mannose-6-phosphate isomerase class I
MSAWQIDDFLAPERVAELRSKIAAQQSGLVLVLGTGASLIAKHWDLLVYADLARWEIQQRQRAHRIGNLGAENSAASPASLYKRAFFLDWRAADRLRLSLLPSIDFFLDTNLPNSPRMVSGDLYRLALRKACERPFRVVPFFDPGPWGGEWMRSHFGLPAGPPNFAWCFDCVPEENSVRFSFGSHVLESPALTLVHAHPRELLGEEVYRRFGAEFPIRFDLLDTMAGGNLSLQVHPLRSFMREHYGLAYTQDESYYMLDAGPDAVVYLGLKDGISPQKMAQDLADAQAGLAAFPADNYVNTWPVQKHNHVSIPAGTIHCSGRNSMVLEVSATPYIFTFKLWDWGRMGLDGRPRPVHLKEGLANIQWDRTTDWVRENLVDRVRPIASGPGWREESTGLDASQFLETRRHWFTQPVQHDTQGNLNVINLVEGAQAIVESPTQAFEPFVVHYAETFIVPASVGAYTISPMETNGPVLATLKAYVRPA